MLDLILSVLHHLECTKIAQSNERSLLCIAVNSVFDNSVFITEAPIRPIINKPKLHYSLFYSVEGINSNKGTGSFVLVYWLMKWRYVSTADQSVLLYKIKCICEEVTRHAYHLLSFDCKRWDINYKKWKQLFKYFIKCKI